MVTTAEIKITDYSELSSVASGDFVEIVDVSDLSQSAAGSSKKIQVTNLVAGRAAAGANSDITSLSGLTTPLSVPQGGSGAATLTGIVKGNGASAMTAVTAPSGTIVGTTDSQTLTNKTLTAPIVNGSITGTYTLAGTPTFPSSVATLTGSQTLTNKTLTSPIISTIVNSGTLTLPTASDTLVGRTTTDTLTNKTLIATTNVISQSSAITSSATPTPTGGSLRNDFQVTALAAGATFAAPSGSPANNNTLIVRVKDNATPQTLAFNAIYRFSTNIPAPTTTVLSKTLYIVFVYNSTDSKWDCVGVINNF